jgi:hypothetical protein
LSYALSPTASLTGEVFHVDEDTLTHVRANAASIRFKKSFARK